VHIHVKNKISSFTDSSSGSINGQDLYDMSAASKEMMLSVKDMINEITLCFAYSKKSVSVHNINEAVKGIEDISKMTT